MPKISLAAARVNAGLSQKEAAKKLNVSNKTLWNWENGITTPKSDKIDSICNLYSLPYDCIKFFANKND